jgi:hypothetical protein
MQTCGGLWLMYMNMPSVMMLGLPFASTHVASTTDVGGPPCRSLPSGRDFFMH